jgi:hypothetical protein
MGDPVVRTYDSKAISMSFYTPAGNVIVSGSGLPDGDFLSITCPDSFEGNDGADGGHDRTNMNNNTIDVEITLKKTSLANETLSTIHETDRLLSTGKGVFNIVDLNGTMYCKSQQAYITKRPDLSMGKSMPTITWTFKFPNAQYNPGYNL